MRGRSQTLHTSEKATSEYLPQAKSGLKNNVIAKLFLCILVHVAQVMTHTIN